MNFCEKHPDYRLTTLREGCEYFDSPCGMCAIEKENRNLQLSDSELRKILDQQSTEILELREDVKRLDVPVYIKPIPHNPRAEAKRAIRSIIPDLEEMVDEIINAAIEGMKNNEK